MCFRYLPHTSFDLHALATPPAFVLSQDQTLHFVSSAPPRRTGTALPTKKKAHTLTYCVARICCVAAPDKARLDFTPIVWIRLQTAVMPQAPFATAHAASHPHNRLHCLLVKEPSGDCKLQSPRCRIAFNTERTVPHTTKQISPVQRPGELFWKNFRRGRPKAPTGHDGALIPLLHNRLYSRQIHCYTVDSRLESARLRGLSSAGFGENDDIVRSHSPGRIWSVP